MRKEDIERVMDLVYPFLKEKANDLSLIDLCDITSKVWANIVNVKEDMAKEYFIINRNQLMRFQHTGHMWFTTKDGLVIEWLYDAFQYLLESGSCLNYQNLPIEQMKELETLFDEDNDMLDINYHAGLVKNYQCDYNTVGWILDHLDAINDVLGFDLKDIETNKEITETLGFYESVHLDICAKDSSGNPIIITGERYESSSYSLIEWLSKAIITDAKKAIYIANEIKTEHQIIVKWLNEYFSKRISFYLIEASRITINKEIEVAISFKLIESPSTGWSDFD